MAMCVAYYRRADGDRGTRVPRAAARSPPHGSQTCCSLAAAVYFASSRPSNVHEFAEPGMIPGRALHRLAAQHLQRENARACRRAGDCGFAEGVLRRRRCREPRRILLAGYVAILKVIAMCAVSVSLESADERRAVARTLAWSVTIVVVTTVLLMVPPLYRRPSSRGWDIAATALPQALALAIPLGVAFGIAFGLRARPTMSIAKTMLVCALAASALNFGMLAWGLPAGNQAFREITLPRAQSAGISRRRHRAVEGIQRNDAVRAARRDNALFGRASRDARAGSPSAFICASRSPRRRSRS